MSAIAVIFSSSSCLRRLEARLASVRANLLFSCESFVAATIITAIGNDGISTSSISDWSCDVCLFLGPENIAASMRVSALLSTLSRFGSVSSLVLRSRDSM